MCSGQGKQLLVSKAKSCQLVAVVAPGQGHWQDQAAGGAPVVVRSAESHLHFAALTEVLRLCQPRRTAETYSQRRQPNPEDEREDSGVVPERKLHAGNPSRRRHAEQRSPC